MEKKKKTHIHIETFLHKVIDYFTIIDQRL